MTADFNFNFTLTETLGKAKDIKKKDSKRNKV